jgi:L-fuconolactonase
MTKDSAGEVGSAVRIAYPDENWLASDGENDILEPDLQILDAHHHFWIRREHEYLLPQYINDIRSGHHVTSSVYVESSAMFNIDAPGPFQPIGETEFANGMAAISASGLYGDFRAAAAIVAFADLTLGDAVRPVLEAHSAAGGKRFAGIRHLAVWDQDPSLRLIPHPPKRPPLAGILSDQKFRSGFKHLADMGLSFDAWLYFTQLEELADLAKAFPDAAIVVDHTGGVIRVGRHSNDPGETFSEWAKNINRIACIPNVHLKFGGLGMSLSGFQYQRLEKPPSSRQLALDWSPYFNHCVEQFGTDRIMFESNFPADKCSYTYLTLWNAFKRLTKNYSVHERRNLFYENAARYYKLGAKSQSRS